MGDNPSSKSDMARGQKGVTDGNQNELYILGHLTKGGSGSNSPKQTGKVPEAAKGYVAKKLSVLLKASGIKEGYGEVMNRSGPGGSIVIHVKNEMYAQKILEMKEIKFNENLIVFEKGDKDTMFRNKIAKRIGVMFMDKEVASYEETKQELLENESVSEIRLMGKPSDERNTFGVIITYKADQEFPTSIGVWGIRKRVSQYLPQPVQCFKCQRFGHRALECRGKERCMICAGAHSNKDCTSRGDMDTTKCINCGKNHTANSKECLIRQKRTLILKKAILEDLPVHEARKKIASTQLQLPPNF